MESLIYKENVSRLPPLSHRKRTKISSAANIKSPTNKMYDSLEIPHDSCRNSKSSGSRSYVRSNINYNTPNPSSPNADESCQHLSYVILQQLASTEHQNALIHDKLVYNEQKMGSVVEEVSRLKKKISDLEEMLQIQSEKNCCCSSGNGCKQLQEKCNQDNQVSVWTSDSSMPSNSSIDFGKLLQAVQELNLIAGQGESKMCYTKSGATFQRSAGIPLTLYANGLILNNGSYRSYDDDSTQQFLQDILDGYFPSEFQNDYPDGVPLHCSVNISLKKKWDILFISELFDSHFFSFRKNSVIQENSLILSIFFLYNHFKLKNKFELNIVVHNCYIQITCIFDFW
ncbi:Protein of unknown function, partial [Gryllus bimaculatus]